MPTYTFRHKETGEIVEHVCKISELDQFKADNPQLERTFVDMVPLGDPVRLGRVHVPDGFRDVLKKIHGRAAGSKLKDYIR